MTYSTRMKGLLGGAALSLMLLPALSTTASAACAGSSFIAAGCFSSIDAEFFYPNNSDGLGVTGFVQVQNSGPNTVPVLRLIGASSVINYVTLSYSAIVVPTPATPGNPFVLTLNGKNLGSSGSIGFAAISGGEAALPSDAPGTYHTVTFFSAIGIDAGGSLNFQAYGTSNPIYAQLGQIAVSAPAPIPGAGFLSFLGMGFAGMFRRGRSLLSRRLALRKSAAQAA